MYGSWTAGRCRSNPSGITEISNKKYQKPANQMIAGFLIILSFAKAFNFWQNCGESM